jgi:hypothetical protein
MSDNRYDLDYTMSKADAVRLIKALSDAMLDNGDVKVQAWRSFPSSSRMFIEINDQPAGVLVEVEEL